MSGSQEWRRDTYHNHGVYIPREGFTILSTRCGITAPGRSAGVASRYFSDAYFSDAGQGAMLVWSRQDGVHATRAEAAAAAWRQDRTGPAFEGEVWADGEEDRIWHGPMEGTYDWLTDLEKGIGVDVSAVPAMKDGDTLTLGMVNDELGRVWADSPQLEIRDFSRDEVLTRRRDFWRDAYRYCR